MATIGKVATAGLSSRTPPQNEQISGLRAGEDIATADLVTIADNGTVMIARTGDTPRGTAALQAQAGEPVTIYRNVRFGYGAGLEPNTDVYMSATVPGGLDDDDGDQVVGFVVDSERIQFTGF